jgi:poly(3-hydroxybutyrate) depolymerase
MSGVFAAAGAALSPSVRTAATREVADALDNMSITSATDTAASLPEGGSVGAARISEATLEDLTLQLAVRSVSWHVRQAAI